MNAPGSSEKCDKLILAPIGVQAAHAVLQAYIANPIRADVRFYIANWDRNNDEWRVVFSYHGHAAAMTIPELRSMAEGCEKGLRSRYAYARETKMPLPPLVDAVETIIACLRYAAISLSIHLADLQRSIS